MTQDIRLLPPSALAPALAQARQTSHTLLDYFGAALNSARLAVPFKENLNPPLWEFGHVAWFTDYWIARNPQRSKGTNYAATEHLPSALAPADGLFNSATVAHETRWQLPLLGITGIHQYLREVALRTEDCLANDLATPKADLAGTANNREQSTAHDSSYFYRLALAHEDMHAEAFYMTAQDLGFGLTETTTPPWQKANRGSAAPAATSTPETEVRNRSMPNTNTPASRVTVTGRALTLAAPSSDFYFDNEAGALSADLESFEIDTQPVSHGAFAAFIEDHGYQRAALWSPEGWAWRQQQKADGPRQVSVSNGRVFRQWFGQTLEVPEWFPMIHVCLYEAEAWARWAGRQLPTEAQWVASAQSAPELFAWGDVWEWTASRFLPFDGFQQHPYKEYSVPWFGDHQVLKGASWITNDRLRNLRFRNFYRPHRADVFAGFRTVNNQT